MVAFKLLLPDHLHVLCDNLLSSSVMEWAHNPPENKSQTQKQEVKWWIHAQTYLVGL